MGSPSIVKSLSSSTLEDVFDHVERQRDEFIRGLFTLLSQPSVSTVGLGIRETATLVEGIIKADLYEQAQTFELIPEPPECPESAGWCAILWFDTKQCTRVCYYKLRGWFCCK